MENVKDVVQSDDTDTSDEDLEMKELPNQVSQEPLSQQQPSSSNELSANTTNDSTNSVAQTPNAQVDSSNAQGPPQVVASKPTNAPSVNPPPPPVNVMDTEQGEKMEEATAAKIDVDGWTIKRPLGTYHFWCHFISVKLIAFILTMAFAVTTLVLASIELVNSPNIAVKIVSKMKDAKINIPRIQFCVEKFPFPADDESFHPLVLLGVFGQGESHCMQNIVSGSGEFNDCGKISAKYEFDDEFNEVCVNMETDEKWEGNVLVSITIENWRNKSTIPDYSSVEAIEQTLVTGKSNAWGQLRFFKDDDPDGFFAFVPTYDVPIGSVRFSNVKMESIYDYFRPEADGGSAGFPPKGTYISHDIIPMGQAAYPLTQGTICKEDDDGNDYCLNAFTVSIVFDGERDSWKQTRVTTKGLLMVFQKTIAAFPVFGPLSLVGILLFNTLFFFSKKQNDRHKLEKKVKKESKFLSPHIVLAKE